MTNNTAIEEALDTLYEAAEVLPIAGAIAVLKSFIDNATMMLEDLAEGQISAYVEAVEEGHLDDNGSWIYQEEHYEYCLKRGRSIATLLGKDPDVFEKEVRDYLCEEYGYGDNCECEDEDDDE